MKILVLTGNYPRRGAETNGIFIHQQVKAMQALGAECRVLMLHNWYPPLGLHKLHTYWQQGHDLKRSFYEELEGVKIHAVPMFVRMPGRLFKDNYYDRAARAVTSYVKGNAALCDADWIYAHFLTDNGYIGAMVKNTLHMKLAAIARGDDVHAWPEQDPSLVNNIRYVFEKADVMLANNKRLAKDALLFADKTVPAFKIAYNGINYSDFAPANVNTEEIAKLRNKYGVPAGKKALLCIARAEYLKGWNELLEVFAENREMLKDWVLLAITDAHKGRYAMSVQEKVRSLSLQQQVLVHEFVPHNEVRQLYWLTDAFILPSYNEGISNAVMEALASGLWVIATDVGGHAEIMQDNVSGFLIQPRSKRAIKESLQYLVTEHDHRKEEIGKQAILAMQALGDYADNAKKLLSYLR
jgi:glycosyltransferase involved in cell wall biosynthesis